MQVFKMLQYDLDDAYRAGNEINQVLSSGLLHVPVVIKQVTPGAGSLFPLPKEAALAQASLVASGFTRSPNIIDSFSFTSIGPGSIVLQGSGTLGDPASVMNLWAGKTPFGGKFAAIVADGDFVVSGGGSLTLNQNHPSGLLLLENAGGTIQLSAFNGIGVTQYQLGNREGWYVRTSQTSGEFVLVPNEQQVRAIVAEMLSGVL
jgi:hypothetical protein